MCATNNVFVWRHHAAATNVGCKVGERRGGGERGREEEGMAAMLLKRSLFVADTKEQKRCRHVAKGVLCAGIAIDQLGASCFSMDWAVGISLALGPATDKQAFGPGLNSMMFAVCRNPSEKRRSASFFVALSKQDPHVMNLPEFSGIMPGTKPWQHLLVIAPGSCLTNMFFVCC